MSNHPVNLDIYDSVGPPAGIVPVRNKDGSEDDSTMISVMQDISTFGIAGRIWDSSYVLDVFMRCPATQYTFSPPCPIPAEYFLASTPKKDLASDVSTASSQLESVTESDQPLQRRKPIRLVEIGAGTGYVGIALAKRLCSDCTLVLTDLEEVVPLLEKNINENLSRETSPSASISSSPQEHATVTAEALAWGNSDHAKAILAQGKIDYIIASDLVYFPELYPPLLQTLRDVTDMDTRVIFGYKERAIWKESPFWEQFGRYFEMEIVRIELLNKDKNKEEAKEEENNEEDEDEDEDGVKVFGCEEGMYVFVAKKRPEDEILEGVDDTLATLMMMQIGY